MFSSASSLMEINQRFKSDEVAKAIVKSRNYFVYIDSVKLSNMNIDLDSIGSLREYNGIL